MRVQSILLGGFTLLSATAVAAPTAHFDFFDDLPSDPELDAYYDMLVARRPCHPAGVHVIGASGAGSNNFHSFGLLSTLMGAILTIDKSTNISLPYPKEAASYDAPDPATAIAKGTANMRRYLRKFFARCPNTPIVLAGYSAGAVMVTNNVCGGQGVGPLPSKFQSNVIAAIGYGDETFTSGQSYDAGTCTDGAGTHPRDPATCAPYASFLKSYCDAPDPDCCGGDDTESHFAYPKYDSDALAFVQSQLQAWTSSHQ